MEIKDLIIFLLIFVIVLWLQNNDDKKYKKYKRESLFDIIKLPLFVSLLILIFKDFDCKIYDTFVEIIQMPDVQVTQGGLNQINPGGLNQINSSGLNQISSLNPLNSRNITSDLNDIFIGPPDF